MSLDFSVETALRLGRRFLAPFATLIDDKFQVPPHIERISRSLDQIVLGLSQYIVLSVPPQHGKSELCTVKFPPFYVGHHPDRKVLVFSHTAELVETFGRRVGSIMEDPLYKAIFPECRIADMASNRVTTSVGGGVTFLGVESASAGRGANLLLIDDALRGAEDARSRSQRDKLWEWFTSEALPRLAPGGSVVIIGTRWHLDDLIGRVLLDPRWERLIFPALAEENDPLGRNVGEPLWREKEWYLARKAQMGSRYFNSLYQCKPTASEGSIFHAEWFQVYASRPPHGRTVIALDCAAKTGEQNDYSVATVWMATNTGYYLVHVWRARVEFPALKRVVIQLHGEWNAQAVIIEDASAGTALIQELEAGTLLPIIPVKVSKDKIARAHAIAPMFESGRVLLPETAAWREDFIDELLEFPSGVWDDQVDSCTLALNYLRPSDLGSLSVTDLITGKPIYAEGRRGPSGLPVCQYCGSEVVRGGVALNVGDNVFHDSCLPKAGYGRDEPSLILEEDGWKSHIVGLFRS